MARRTYDPVLVDEYLGLIAGGVAYMEANRRLGVSFGPGLRWWAKFAPVDFPQELFNTGRTGGLRGVPAPAMPRHNAESARRPLSEADRAVIAAWGSRIEGKNDPLRSLGIRRPISPAWVEINFAGSAPSLVDT